MFLLARDLRYTARTLRRTPGFAISASLILALGIGAATTTFSVANAVLFRSLPFPHPETLVSVFEWTPRGNREGVAPATFLDWRAQNRCFTVLATSRGLDINFTGAGEPEQLGGATVSEGMFELLGAVPSPGRGFAPGDYRAGAPRTAILSHKFWQRSFAADPNVLGRIILLGGKPHTIIGVMPASFWFFWGRMDVWTPLRFTSKDLAGRGGRASLMTIGRLKSGVSLSQAQAEMEALSARLLDQHRDMQGWGVKVRPLHEQDELVRRARPALRLLLGAVAVVMLIVCANLANLLLARGSGRAKEIAIRAALGASRGALVAQLLVEALVLAAIGGALGVLFANWGIRLAATLIPEDLRMSLPAGPEQIGINSEILLFALAVSLFTGLLFGLAPALQLSQPKLGLTMQRPRHILAAAEIALSLVLLIAATLLLQSYVRAYRLDLGYRPDGVQAMLLLGVKQAAADEIVSKVEAIPTVQAAGLAGPLPGWPVVWPFDFRRMDIEGATQDTARALQTFVRGRYFEAMGFTLLRGRYFTREENQRERNVVIINRELARRYALGTDPIGKRLRPAGSPPQPWLTVVGVVGDEHHPLNGEPMPAFYRPGVSDTPPYLLVRAAAEMAPAIRARIWSATPDQPVLMLGSMEKIVAEARSPVRFGLVLMASFAAIALVLAAMGIYAVMAYVVRARTHEIGIRMALGAGRRDIFAMVVRQALAITLAGVAAGAAIALLAARWLTRDADPFAILAVSAFLILTAMAAAYIPARRAAAVDPLTPLKSA